MDENGRFQPEPADKLQAAGQGCMSLGCMLMILVPVAVFIIALLFGALGGGK